MIYEENYLHIFAVNQGLNTILITAETAALSIGMTMYIWISKETYQFSIIIACGCAADAITFVFFGLVWTWYDALIASLVL